MPSVEEVKFGIVPGLADLAAKMSNAFANRRSREMDFEIAKLQNGEAQRKAQAKALEEQLKKDEEAEEARRTDLGKNVSRANQLNKTQEGLRPSQGSIDNPTEAEILRFRGLESADPTARQSAQNDLKNIRALGDHAKGAAKTGNVPQAANLMQIEQLLASGQVKASDLGLNLGDDESLMKNIGYGAGDNQQDLNAESRAVASNLNNADLSHLSPEEQASIQAKSADLEADLPPGTYNPQDTQKQLAYLQQYVAYAPVMQQPAGAFFATAIGLDLSGEEKQTIDEVMGQIDEAAAQEFPGGSGDPQQDREAEIDRTIAGGMAREEIATIMKARKVSIYDAADLHAAGKGAGRSLLYADMDRKYNTPMTAQNQALYSQSRAAIAKSNLTPRQQQAFAVMNTITGGKLPAAAINTFVKIDTYDELDAELKKFSKGFRGHRDQDKTEPISIDKQDAMARAYKDFSLDADDFGGKLQQEQANNTLMAIFGFPDAAAIAEQNRVANQQRARRESQAREPQRQQDLQHQRQLGDMARSNLILNPQNTQGMDQRSIDMVEFLRAQGNQ